MAQDRPALRAQPTAQPPIKCTCRYRGQDFHLGEVICLSTSGGPRIAQCEMALNNTSWTITEGPCPTVQAPASPSSPNLAALDPALD